jgi:hypothetical protein
MPFNANFTRVTLHDDGSLGVAGTSEPAAASNAILVSLVHSGVLRPGKVKHPHQLPWSAEFPAGDAPFAVGDEVVVVGVALRGAADPFVWHGSFEIKGKQDV